MLIIFTL